jgi:hypothetical protein
MVGVAQFHLAPDLPQIFRTQRTFDGALRTHIHKHRGLHRTMGAGKFTSAGFSFCFL